jgi:hypothetical protein
VLANGDQSTCGLNFDPKRPRREVLADYVAVLDSIYTPEAFFSRLREQCRAVKRPRLQTRLAVGPTIRVAAKVFGMLWRMTTQDGRVRSQFWRTIFDCARRNPANLKYAVALSAVYFDVGPLGSVFSAQMRREIELIDRGQWQPLPAAMRSTQFASAAALAS